MGRLRITNEDYSVSLADKTTDEYFQLYQTLSPLIVAIINTATETGSSYIEDMTFIAGSVITDYVVSIDNTTSTAVIYQALFDAAENGEFGNFIVDPESIRFEGNEYEEEDEKNPKSSELGTTEIIGIAVGAALGVIVIALVAVSVLFIAHRRRGTAKAPRYPQRGDDSQDLSSYSSESRFQYPDGFRRNYLMWQSGGSMPRMHPAASSAEPYRQHLHRSPHLPPRQQLNDTYDQEKLRSINHAVDMAPQIDWSVIRNFSRKNRQGYGQQQMWRAAPSDDYTQSSVWSRSRDEGTRSGAAWTWREQNPRIHRDTPHYLQQNGNGSLDETFYSDDA